MINIAKTKTPFCKEYYQMVKKQLISPKYEHDEYIDHFYNYSKPNNRVGYHSVLTRINKFLMGMDTPFFDYWKEIIKRTDIEFKSLQKTTEKLTVWRGIEKTQNNAELFERNLRVKPGEIVSMRGYTYASPHINYAEDFAEANGIIYKIEIPKGAQLSSNDLKDFQGEVIFPRSSRFECIANKKNDKGQYIIELKYIIPDD